MKESGSVTGTSLFVQKKSDVYILVLNFNKSNYFFNKITILFTITQFCVIISLTIKIVLSENLKN